MTIPPTARPWPHLVVAWSGAAVFASALAWFAYAYLVRFAALPARGSRTTAIAIDLVLFTLFALHHSLFARTSIKMWVRATIPPALERSTYTWVASLLFLAVCTAWRGVPGTAWTLDGAWRVAGYGLQAAGLVITAVGSARLDVFDLAGVRQVQQPHQAAAAPLETTGLYGFVRHPLYLGWALFVFGAPDMTATRLTFAAISTAYLALAIPIEERSLRESFGPAYADYQGRVRWRMVPGVY
jgi:methanethiol S-methyltransferase